MPAYHCCLCDRRVEYEGPLPSVYPFCSPRCKLIDLGKWLHEDYTIDRDLTPDDLPDPNRHTQPPERHV